jgi:RNA polymerase sigma-70 factor, ECF subfamily
MRVLDDLPEYQPHLGPFRSWLFGIVRDTAITHLPRNRWPSPAQFSEHGQDQSAGPTRIGQISDDQLLASLQRLPKEQQQVMLLRYLFELSSAEIAHALERRPDSIRDLHRLAMRTLRIYLEPTTADLTTV